MYHKVFLSSCDPLKCTLSHLTQSTVYPLTTLYLGCNLAYNLSHILRLAVQGLTLNPLLSLRSVCVTVGMWQWLSVWGCGRRYPWQYRGSVTGISRMRPYWHGSEDQVKDPVLCHPNRHGSGYCHPVWKKTPKKLVVVIFMGASEFRDRRSRQTGTFLKDRSKLSENNSGLV